MIIAAASVDLVAQSLTPAGKFASGKPASAALRVQNAGTIPSTSTVSVQVIASPNTTLGDGDDVTIATMKISLKPGAAKTYKLKFKLGGTSGSFFLVAVLDSANALAELNEANNSVFSSSPVQIS